MLKRVLRVGCRGSVYMAEKGRRRMRIGRGRFGTLVLVGVANLISVGSSVVGAGLMYGR